MRYKSDLFVIVTNNNKMPPKRTNLRATYTCVKCHTEVSVVKYRMPESKICNACARKNRKPKIPFSDIVKLFQDNNCVLITREDQYGGTRKGKLEFECISCSKPYEKWYSDILGNFTCKPCSIAKALTGMTRQEFFDNMKQQFADIGYELLTECEDYENCQSKLLYKCNKGHEGETTQNRFTSGGHGCSRCANQAKNAYLRLAEHFESLGLELLTTEEEYQDKNASIDYICRCGSECQVTWSTAQRPHWDGCLECLYEKQRHKLSDVADYFDDQDCTLLSTEYENVNEELYYECSCGGYGLTSYKDFKNGKRCRDCIVQRRGETNIEIYGFPNVLQNEEIKRKAKAKCKERFGVEHIMQRRDKVLEAQATNMVRYGAKYKFCTPEILAKAKEAVFAKYGVEYAMQNAEVYSKAMASCFGKKEYVFPSGRKEDVRGYECFCLDDLINDYGVPEEDIVVDPELMPEIWYTNPETERVHRYYPDIWIPTRKWLIEVKSMYIFNRNPLVNIAKFEEVASRGYKFDVMFYKSVNGNNKNVIIDELWRFNMYATKEGNPSPCGTLRLVRIPSQ